METYPFLIRDLEIKEAKTGKKYALFNLLLDMSYPLISTSCKERLKSLVSPDNTVFIPLYCWGFDVSLVEDTFIKGSVLLLDFNKFSFDNTFWSSKEVFSFKSILPFQRVLESNLNSRFTEWKASFIKIHDKIVPTIPSQDSWMELINKLVELSLSGDPVESPFYTKLRVFFVGKAKEFYDLYKEYPAAHKNHHAYPGGLLIHTEEALTFLKSAWKPYNDIVETSVIETAISVLYHDWSKANYEYTKTGEYKDALYLYSHPSLSAHKLLSDLEEEFVDCNDEIHLELIKIAHCVLAHHCIGGTPTLSYGSPVTPQSPEALLTQLCDMASGFGTKYKNNESRDHYYFANRDL